MAGLAALKSYGSGSSSGSDEDEDIDHPDRRKKRQRMNEYQTTEEVRLPLPSEILSMFGKANHPSEERGITDHQGRIRSFAHVPGNWATFVYIPAESTSLCNLVETLVACLPDDLTFNLHDDLHLSLSRTVCLQYHWIEPFTQSLSEMINGVRGFRCHIEHVDVYTNDEKTRTFLGLKIGAGHNTLCDLVKLCDECLSEFSLPVFYKNPSFHLSFCWCVGDVSSKIEATVLSDLRDRLSSHQGNLTINVQEIHCKSGCKKFVFPLR